MNKEMAFYVNDRRLSLCKGDEISSAALGIRYLFKVESLDKEEQITVVFQPDEIKTILEFFLLLTGE